jgi:hypothetical protein
VKSQIPKNPRRVAAGKRNRQLRRGLTADGRQRLRQSALRNRPWEHSTGPVTPLGKAKVSLNGKKHQFDPLFSIRDAKEWSAEVTALLEELESSYSAHFEGNSG